MTVLLMPHMVQRVSHRSWHWRSHSYKIRVQFRTGHLFQDESRKLKVRTEANLEA